MSNVANHQERYSAYIQFADFDGTDNMIPSVSLGLVPRAGDSLNIIYEQMLYFLEVERVTHIVDCDHAEIPDHGVTIDCKLRSSRPRVRVENRK